MQQVKNRLKLSQKEATRSQNEGRIPFKRFNQKYYHLFNFSGGQQIPDCDIMQTMPKRPPPCHQLPFSLLHRHFLHHICMGTKFLQFQSECCLEFRQVSLAREKNCNCSRRMSCKSIFLAILYKRCLFVVLYLGGLAHLIIRGPYKNLPPLTYETTHLYKSYHDK